MAEVAYRVESVRVEIEAPAELVWEVLVDLPRYGEWNGFNPRIESTLRLGDDVRMLAVVPATGERLEIVEQLCAIEPGRLLAWEQRATAANPDAGRREQHLLPLGPGRCAYHHTDTFLGVNAAKIMAEHGAWVKQGFDGMARDLKRRAEALWSERRRGSAAAASAS